MHIGMDQPLHAGLRSPPNDFRIPKLWTKRLHAFVLLNRFNRDPNTTTIWLEILPRIAAQLSDKRDHVFRPSSPGNGHLVLRRYQHARRLWGHGVDAKCVELDPPPHGSTHSVSNHNISPIVRRIVCRNFTGPHGSTHNVSICKGTLLEYENTGLLCVVSTSSRCLSSPQHTKLSGNGLNWIHLATEWLPEGAIMVQKWFWQSHTTARDVAQIAPAVLPS